MGSIRLRLPLACGIALLMPLGLSLVAQPVQPTILIGSGDGGGTARELRATDGSEVASGLPFGPGFTGGVRVAAGDVNGDGIPDRIVASGPGSPGQILVLSGQNSAMLLSVLPFGPTFTGGVSIATGDVDADGRADLIAGAGMGSGQVSLLSGVDGHTIASGQPFGNVYVGGVTVAAGDFTGDGRADVVVGTVTGGLVQILNGVDASVIASGFPYGPLFLGGVNVAAGDVSGDGRLDVITAPRTSGNLVRVFNGADISVIADFVPYPGSGGVNVAAGDINDDGRADIVTGPATGPPNVKVFDGFTHQLLSSFMALNPSFSGGVFVATLTRGTGPMRFTSSPNGTLTAGQPGTIAITTSGGLGTTMTSAGALPAGVTFTDNGNGTATLGGTPAAGTGGSYALTLSASRSGAALGESPLTRATQSFTLTVREAPAFTSPGRAEFTVTRSGSFRVTTSGFPRPALTSSGGWPMGVSFADQGDGSALITGVPVATGIFISTITATNALGETATQLLTLMVSEVAPPPAGPPGADVVFTSATAATWTVGSAHTFQVTTSSAPAAHTITLGGVLPAGVTFTSNGDGTATLAGLPPVGSVGTYQFAFTGINGVGTAGLQTFTLTILDSPLPIFTSGEAVSFSIGATATFVVTATSAPPVTSLTLSAGVLPSGVSVTDNGNGTATMAGIPAPGTAGNYPLTFSATNANGTVTQNVLLTVTVPSGAAPAITSANATTFVVGTAGSFTLTTTGTPTASTITVSGALPGGVIFTNNANGTATLAGTPEAGTAGTYSLVFSATNANGTATQDFTLTVQNVTSSPTFTSATSTTFRIGAPGTFAITTVAEPAVTTITLTGTPPPGVTFTDNGDGTATLAGTPTAGAGQHALVFSASNGGAPVTQAFTLTVHQAPAITSANAVTFQTGVAGTFTVTTVGTPVPSITRLGALPTGVTFTDHGDGTATLGGTAPSAGVHPLTITALNGVGDAATQSFTLTVSGNALPVANADAGATTEDLILTVAAPGVLANDADADAGDTKTVVAVNGNPANVGQTFATGVGGRLRLNADGSYSYNPTFHVPLQALTTGQILIDTFTYVMQDAAGAQSSATVTITLTGVNDPPVVGTGSSGGIGLPTFTEGGSGLTIAPAPSVFDPDDSLVQSISVQITGNYQSGADVLTFIDQPGLTSAWDPGIGRLTVTGPAGVASFVAALQSVRFSNPSDAPSTAQRTIAFVAHDDEAAGPATNRLVNVVAVNDLPVIDLDANDSGGVTGANYAISFTENNPAMVIADAADATIADLDHTTLASVTVTLTNLLDPSFETLDVDLIGADPAFTKTYDTATTPGQGVLTITASPPQATSAFQTLLRKVTYRNTDDDPNLTPRAITVAANDGIDNGNAATTTVALVAVNDTPSAVNDAATTNEDTVLEVNAEAGVLANDDPDGGGDSKTVVAVNGSAANVGVQILTGKGARLTIMSGGAYVYGPINELEAAALHALKGGQQTTDSVSYTMRDGDGVESSATLTITVTGVNDRPFVVGGPGNASYTEDAAPVVLAPNADVIDRDDSILAFITLQITENYENGQDVLGFTNQLGITGTWVPSTGTLTLTGPAPLVDFQTAVRTVTFVNTSHAPSAATRQVTFVPSDGELAGLGFRFVEVVAVNDRPVVDLDADNSTSVGLNFATTFTENGPAVVIADTDATITDPDDTTLTSLTVRLPINDATFEFLDVDLTGADPAFSKTYDTTTLPGSGILTITAAPPQPIAAFEALLRAVTYRNLADTPNVVVVRVIVTRVSDDDAFSLSPANAHVLIVAANDAPAAVNDVLTTDEDTIVNRDAAAGLLANDDPDAGGDSKTVVAVNGSAVSVGLPAPTAKNARVTVNADGSFSYDPTFGATFGTLQALAPGEQTTDTFTYTMQDGAAVQSSATVTITVTGVNDAPRVIIGSIILGGPTYTEDAAPMIVVPIAQILDPDDAIIASATLQITGNYQNGQDVLAFTNQLGITGNWDPATGTLTLTGPASNANFETAARTVTYVNTSPNPNTTQRMITLAASDGDATNSVASPFNVAAVNDAPAISVTPGTLAYTDGDPATVIDPGVAITDVDDDNIESAQVQITASYHSGFDVLGFTPQFGITGSFNPSNGRLSLSGSATKAQYAAVLQTVTFVNGSNHPSTATRTVSWVVNDGNADSSTAIKAITVTEINSAPNVNNDTFDILGNTEARVDLPAGPTPHVSVTTPGPSPLLGLLDNDSDPDGDPLVVTAIASGCADPTAPFDCTLSDGAVVHAESNGAFSYTPAPGATTGTLDYSVSDGLVTVGRTATFNIIEMVWYVKNDAPPGNGTSIAPFNALTAINGAGGSGDVDGPDDYIFVFYGNGTNDGQGLGLALEVGQHLIGEFNGLSIPVNLNGNGSPTIVVPQPSATACESGPCRPLITHPADNVLTAFNVVPAEIAGFRLLAGGNTISLFIDVPLTDAPPLAIHHNVFEGAGADGIDVNLDSGTTGTLQLRIENNAWNPAGVHGGTGVDIEALAGTLNLAFNRNTDVVGVIGVDVSSFGAATTTITEFAGNSIHGDAQDYGIVIAGVTFDAVPGGAVQQVQGDTLVVGSSGNPVFDRGVFLNNVRGNLFFDDLDVFAFAPLSVLGPLDHGFMLAVEPAAPDGTGTSSLSGYAPISIGSAIINLRLENVSAPATGLGIVLESVGGTLRAAPGSAITKIQDLLPDRGAFYVDNAVAAPVPLTVQYEGTITNESTSKALIINSAGAGSAISFTGPVSDTTGLGTGVTLTANTGATINFTGGLMLSTGAADAFTATGGGTVAVLDPPGVASNTITTTTGRALEVSNTTIGAAGLTFERISSGVAGGSGPVNGILLDTTGNLGGLTVTGSGGLCTVASPLTCSGGTIQSSTSDAIRLVSTRDVSLAQMRIHDNDTNGIYGDELTNFSLSNSVVTDNDVTNPGPLEAGIKFNELYGTATITNTVVRGTRGDNIRLEMASGTLNNFTVSNSTIGPTAFAGGTYSNGLSIITSGAPGPTITATVNNNSLFTGVDSTRQQLSGIFTSIGGGTTTLSVLGSDFDNQNVGINLNSTAGGTHRFNVDDNDLTFHLSPAIALGGTSVMNGTVNNNRVGIPATADSGSELSAGISAVHGGNGAWTLAITNNNVRHSETEGVLVRIGNNAGNTATVNLSLIGNTVAPPDDNTGATTVPSGIRLTAQELTTLCANVATNESRGNGAATGYFLEKVGAPATLQLQGWDGNATTTLTTNDNTTNGVGPMVSAVPNLTAFAPCAATLPSFP